MRTALVLSVLGMEPEVGVTRSPEPVLSSRPARLLGARLSLVVLWLLACAAPAIAATPDNVLVLYSYGRLLPANIEGDRGLTAEFAARPDVPVTLFTEFLESERFSGEAYERAFLAYLRDKYALRPPKVIVVAGDEAMGFITRRRAELFPQVPIVHMAVEFTYLQSLGPLPPDVIGTARTFDFVRTVEQALRWHPRARHLVLVTGSSPMDRAWEARMRADAAELPRGLALVFLAGLSGEDLRDRLRRLPADSIVYTPGFFRDGKGREFVGREASRMIAAAASSPVYGPFSSHLGTGIVGGRMASFETMGASARRPPLRCSKGLRRPRWPSRRPCPRHCRWTGGNCSAGAFLSAPSRPTPSCVSRKPRCGRPTATRCSSASP